jgi:DNA-binding response OmpR family regulator
VRTAHDGPSALRDAAVFRPEVVVLDLGLPDLDGYEVARRLRGDARFASSTIVALTGYGEERHRRRSEQAGFDHHFTKPVDIERLEAILAARPDRPSRPN